MKKTGDASSLGSGGRGGSRRARSSPRRSGIDAAAEQDVETFLSILGELSGMLRDLGYADQGAMLLDVKRDMLQRLQAALPLLN